MKPPRGCSRSIRTSPSSRETASRSCRYCPFPAPEARRDPSFDNLPTPAGASVMPGTVRLHRVLTTRPQKIYRAFIEPDAVAKWLPPNGFTATVHHMDARVRGSFRMSFRNFTNGQSHSFGGQYLELSPGERLRYTDKFEDPNLPGDIVVTVTL